MLGNKHVQFLGGWGAVMPSRLPGVEPDSVDWPAAAAALAAW
jgi:hypothetical protein